MKFMQKIRGVPAMLLAAVTLLAGTLLPGCSFGITDPLGDDAPGDAGASLRSEAEADELFGAASAQYTPMFDYPYLYYTGKLYPNSEKDKLTVYRYNIETGESEYACQDSVCTHDEDSGCPFADYYAFGQLSVVDGGVVYTTSEKSPHPLEWYDPVTRKHKVLVEDADNRYVIGNTLYFDRTDFSEEAAANGEYATIKQLWRYDTEKGAAVLVASTKDKNDGILTPVLSEGEEKIVISSHYDYTGKLDAEKVYLYWVDAETGQRTPVMKEGIEGTGIGWYAGRYFCYDEVVTNQETGEYEGYNTYLIDLPTGEKRTLDEGNLSISRMIPTERYILAVFDDPAGEVRGILRCYDLGTGEWAKEYPLTGDYTGAFLRYYRGQLYFMSSAKVDDLQNATGELAIRGYLQWDILSGEQRLIPYSEWQ